MNLSKVDNRILRFLKIFLAACLAAPLLAGASFIFPYTVPKIFAFRVLVEIAAVLYFYLALKYPAEFFTPLFKRGERESRRCEEAGVSGTTKQSRVSSSALISIAVFIFLFFSFLSAVFGVDFYTSWWGNLGRGMGVWSLAHFVAWFLMLTVIFKGNKDWQMLIKLSVVVSILVAATALIQRLGGWGSLLPATDRIFGLIGNPGLLGGYLLFNVFLAGYLSFESVGWKKRLFAISSLLLALCLFLTGTRGAYLGLAAGVVVFLLLMLFVGKQRICHPELGSGSKNTRSRNEFGMTNKKRGFIFILLALILVLIASLFFFRPISLSDDATTQSRLILWQDSWQAWQARPLLGFGPENFEAGMGKYLSPRLAEFEAYAADRAHNFIFDYGVTSGWLGLMGYLAIIVAAGWALFKNLLPERSQQAESRANPAIDPSTRFAAAGLAQGIKRDYYFSIIFLALLVAYLVQNFFIFDSFVSYLMLFFALGMVSGASLRGAPSRNGETAQQSNPVPNEINIGLPRALDARKDNFSLFKKLILLFVIVYSLFAIYAFNFKPLLAAYRANRILSLPAGEASQAAPLLKDVLALNTFASPEIAYQTVIDYIDKINRGLAPAQDEEFFAVASSELIKIISRSPDQPKNYLALAWLDIYFSGLAPQRIDEAIILGGKAKELSPNKKDAYLVLAAAYALSGQSDKAQEIISQARAVDGKMGKEVKEYYEKVK